ncbi:lactate/malate family dehydrogenase [Lancefieldella rimae]
MALVSKIGIIGTGHVGAHVANALLFKGLATELYLSDLDEVLCKAQVNDLLDAMPFYPHPARIFEVDTRYEELADCDIIVNAAGHIEAAAASRDGELFVTTDEARTFAKRISDAGFKGIWVSIANPCDVVSTEIQYLTDCDPTRVIGSGTTLDSARFRHALSVATGYPASCINAWMLGEHGNGQFALWSHVTFGCLTDKEVEAQTGLKFDRAQLEQDARMGGYVTYKGKHCTEYSIANGAVEVIGAIVNDTKLVTPVSTQLNNVYGASGFYSSLPAVIGKDGVEKVLVPELSDDEIAAWKKSCEHVKGNIDQLDWLKVDARVE